jgi:hypothetical protein
VHQVFFHHQCLLYDLQYLPTLVSRQLLRECKPLVA